MSQEPFRLFIDSFGQHDKNNDVLIFLVRMIPTHNNIDSSLILTSHKQTLHIQIFKSICNLSHTFRLILSNKVVPLISWRSIISPLIILFAFLRVRYSKS